MGTVQAFITVQAQKTLMNVFLTFHTPPSLFTAGL